MTTTLYIFIVLSYLVDHLDLGIFAVSATEIQEDLDITESDIGLLESALYIGNIIGSLLCPVLFRVIHPKILILVATVFNALLLLPFCFTSYYWVLFGTRILVGLFQVTISIPVTHHYR